MNFDILSEFEDKGIVLVKHVISKDFSPSLRYFQRDDLISAGTTGLIQACRTFDAARCHDPTRFFCMAVKNAIVNFIRKECHFNKRTKEARRIFTFTDYGFPERVLENRWSYLENFYCDEVDKLFFHLNTLPEQNRKAVLNYYFRDVSHEALAKEMGIPKTRLFLILKISIEFFQKHFYKEAV